MFCTTRALLTTTNTYLSNVVTEIQHYRIFYKQLQTLQNALITQQINLSQVKVIQFSNFQKCGQCSDNEHIECLICTFRQLMLSDNWYKQWHNDTILSSYNICNKRT